ncbi:MAG: hypothetical protein ACUZ8O_16600, partial [Candidatus Anammoxibacter sp.]
MLLIYEIFYEILFFISFLGLVIGLFDPKLVVLWGKTKTRLRVILIYGTALVVFLVLISIVVSMRNDRKKTLIIKPAQILTKVHNI